MLICFDRDPAAGAAGPAAPASYKANVNRQKTKRWVEAKLYSYDGDDWGDVDEYDEFQANQDYQPPASQTAGYRHAGQGIGSSAPSFATGRGHSAGDMPRPQSDTVAPAGSAIQYSPQHVSDASVQHHFTPAYETTEVADSPGGVLGSPGQHQGAHVPRRFSDIEAMHTTPPLRVDTSRPDSKGGLAPSYRQEHRAPISHSPSPHSAAISFEGGHHPVSVMAGTPVSAITHRFPPRKSSLTHSTSIGADSPRSASHSVTSNPAHSNEHSPVPPTTRPRTISGSNQSAPFIRPADIYKRIEDERNRERRLSESTRRSTDSLSSRRTEPEPIAGPSVLDPLQDTEGPQQDDNDEKHRRTKTRLDPVTERKSEYGMEGLLSSYTASGGHGDDHLLPPTENQELVVKEPTLLSADAADTSRPAGLSSPPSLPALPRLSGFGGVLWPVPASEEPSPQNKAEQQQKPLTLDDAHLPSTPSVKDSQPVDIAAVKHQSSLGFRSVVEHAFDRGPDTKSVPPTPTDSSNTTPLAEPHRSDTTSTSAISPIMTRAPSALCTGENSRVASQQDTSIVGVSEEGAGADYAESVKVHETASTGNVNKVFFSYAIWSV